MERSKYLIAITYDGSAFCGWQVQATASSIQATIQVAIAKILNSKTVIHGSGRTDAGVHALCQYAHFYADKLPGNFLYKLNAILPPAIRIFALWSVPESFHARFSAEKKLYRYRMIFSDRAKPIFMSPFKNGFVHKFYNVDPQRLGEVAKLFCGKKDFSAFANARPGNYSNERNMVDIAVKQVMGESWIELLADGFLYKMARNIVGTMVFVAQNRLSLSAVERLFEKKDRRLAPPPAPAHALFLVKVIYPADLWQEAVLLENCDNGTLNHHI